MTHCFCKCCCCKNINTLQLAQKCYLYKLKTSHDQANYKKLHIETSHLISTANEMTISVWYVKQAWIGWKIPSIANKSTSAAAEMKFSIKFFFCRCHQTHRKLRISSHLLKKILNGKRHFMYSDCCNRLTTFLNENVLQTLVLK